MAILFVIMASITIRFGRSPRNGGIPPKDNIDVNIIRYIYIYLSGSYYYLYVPNEVVNEQDPHLQNVHSNRKDPMRTALTT